MDSNDYQVCEDSDSEGYDSSSSEDAFEAYVRKKYLSETSPEDDFEKEMQAELSATVRDFECKYLFEDDLPDRKDGTGASKSQPSNTTEGSNRAGVKATETKNCEAAEMTVPKVAQDGAKAGASGPSNDDLLYDPGMDDEDEKWVNEQRRVCIFPEAQPKTGADTSQVKPLPLSDAVLNCPACMTLLCLDCQRHEIYNTQYRAMFVRNCVIAEKEVLKCPPSRTSAKRRRNLPDGVDDPRDLFKPVRCGVCSTEVAVYDSEEVYHFFNVIASFS